MQVEIDAQLQELGPDLRVIVEQRLRRRRPILGESRDEVLLFRVQMLQQRVLEREPCRLQLLEVAPVGARHDGLEGAVQAIVIAREHALQRRKPLRGDHDACLASTGSSTSGDSANDGN